jgi:hypothetical protein
MKNACKLGFSSASSSSSAEATAIGFSAPVGEWLKLEENWRDVRGLLLDVTAVHLATAGMGAAHLSCCA